MIKTLINFDLNRELLLTLYKSKLGPIGSGLIMPLLFAIIYYQFVPQTILFVWLFLNIVVLAVRLIYAQQIVKKFDQLNHAQLKSSLIVTLVIIFCGSLLWGLSSIFIIQYAHEPLYLFIFFIMISGMASSAVSMLSTVFQSIFVFMFNMFFVSGASFIFLGSTQLDYFLAFSLILYFVFTLVAGQKNYIALSNSIKQKSEIAQLNSELQDHYKQLDEKAKALEETKKEIEQILDSILLPVLITDKQTRQIIYANNYAAQQYGASLDHILGSDIEKLYTTKEQGDKLRDMIEKKGFIQGIEETFVTHGGKEFTAILSVIPINYKGRPSYIGMTTDITKQKRIESQIRQMHKHTRDSIEYASLIQDAIVPSKELFKDYFSEYFTYWKPKDIVGGDIYLFEPINHQQTLLLVIDCTGHGVPGAFVTMLVKAIQVQVSSMIQNNNFIEVDPAWILSYFNQTIKRLLKQESQDSLSNAGFDGAVVYYDKQTRVLKYAGAQTPLFYTDESEQIVMIKGDRHSVGYKKSDSSFEFTTHTLEVTSGMQFYITTDGYLDQNGGEKDFPYGKKRFLKLLSENRSKSMKEQKKVLENEFATYKFNKEQNDDITVIGFKI